MEAAERIIGNSFTWSAIVSGKSGKKTPVSDVYGDLAKPASSGVGKSSRSAGRYGGASKTADVQLKTAGEASTEGVHAAADRGVSGPGSSLPFLDKIQSSFGDHDVSSVSAHTGGSAAQANKDMGATAYATGNSVAFGGAPDLHTAAHEAAHVVQQRAGVQLAGGVGAAGDKYERNADAVADRVVAGESASDLLGSTSGSTGNSVQAKSTLQKRALQFDGKPKKKVSGKAMGWIGYAAAAIKHTKEVMAFGAGNQKEALEATNFNSYYRMKVMRDNGCFDMTPEARKLAMANPDAFIAAKADLAQGGNCGEHAMVAFDHIRANAPGVTINRADVEGLDHAFVILGDIKGESDADLAVSDPWPTAPTACIWEDHFAYTPERAKINARNTMVADGRNVKKVILAGLKLNARGQAMIKQKMSDKDTKKQVKDGLGGWIWEHANAADTEYDYHSDDGGGAAGAGAAAGSAAGGAASGAASGASSSTGGGN